METPCFLVTVSSTTEPAKHLLVESIEVCILKTSLYAKGALAKGSISQHGGKYRGRWFVGFFCRFSEAEGEGEAYCVFLFENVHPMFVLRSKLLIVIEMTRFRQKKACLIERRWFCGRFILMSKRQGLVTVNNSSIPK